MKIVVTARILVPVITEVEADTEEEALGIARKRLLGHDPSREWTLDEKMFDRKDELVLS